MLTVSHLFNDCQFHKNSRNKYQIENIKILSNEKGFENVKKKIKKEIKNSIILDDNLMKKLKILSTKVHLFFGMIIILLWNTVKRTK